MTPLASEFKPVFVVFGGDSDDGLDGEVWCSLVVQVETASNFVDEDQGIGRVGVPLWTTGSGGPSSAWRRTSGSLVAVQTPNA